MNDIRELNDAELEAIFGGNCAGASLVGAIHATTALALDALGNHAGAMYFAGKANGNINGGCQTG